ncbi:hypothetical protein QR680_018874 [Steinernema hermaphroditum]|uniref:C2 domain-containing protein n=1 Tax=Steinernema hermaphroditum TaxID=289476 RepID=A0AA39LRE7_9BILA|nr:hypothetical protein QR680_018874 [Steinernema hermaphroditum]
MKRPRRGGSPSCRPSSSLSDDVFVPPPRGADREEVPRFVSPGSYAVAASNEPAAKKHRPVRVKILAARKIPPPISEEEETPATFVTVGSEGAELSTPVYHGPFPEWSWSGTARIPSDRNSVVLRLKQRCRDGSEKILGVAVVDCDRTRSIQEVQMGSMLSAREEGLPILAVQVYEECPSPEPGESAASIEARLQRTIRKLKRNLSE